MDCVRVCLCSLPLCQEVDTLFPKKNFEGNDMKFLAGDYLYIYVLVGAALALPRSYDNLMQDQYASISFDNLFPFPALNMQ
jgi:hypothetical protein